MVPIARLLFNFNATDAISLSNITIAASGLIGYLFNFRKRHPLKKDLDGKPSGTLMEYSIAIVLLPMGVVGATCGSIISYLLPEPILIGVLTATLVYIFITTALKLKRMCKAENEAKAKAAALTTPDTELTSVVQDSKVPVVAAKAAADEGN